MFYRLRIPCLSVSSNSWSANHIASSADLSKRNITHFSR
jgi:hypothetical protein